MALDMGGTARLCLLLGLGEDDDMEKKTKSDAREKPVLRLRRRPLVDLSDHSLREVAGGHSCDGTCPQDASCAQTCPPQATCDGSNTCDPGATFCEVCPSVECQTLPFDNCTAACP